MKKLVKYMDSAEESSYVYLIEMFPGKSLEEIYQQLTKQNIHFEVPESSAWTEPDE